MVRRDPLAFGDTAACPWPAQLRSPHQDWGERHDGTQKNKKRPTAKAKRHQLTATYSCTKTKENRFLHMLNITYTYISNC